MKQFSENLLEVIEFLGIIVVAEMKILNSVMGTMVKIMEAITEETRREFFPDEVFFQMQAFHNSGIGIGDLAGTYMPLGRELAFCRVVERP